jgi:glyoxylase-like metal-dependent hydrolase (beta-lactamase superfamily II)
MRAHALLAALLPAALFAQTLPSGIEFHRGPSNIVTVGTTAIYGVPRTPVERVLLTHARRDAISAGGSPAKFIVPAAERDLFADPGKFWAALETARFHDYAQLGTKVPVTPVPVARTAAGGDRLDDGIRVIDTPGFTRGAVSYIIERGGKRIACTGDLIYGDGQLLDLYSLQDAVPDAKARGYHGYAARAGDLIGSLRRIREEEPDVILPARGAAIANPQAAIASLIARLEAFLASHYETDALRWYWGDANHKIRSAAAAPMDIMPMAEQQKLPPDILPIGNSRLIVSKSGNAFLVDAGYRNLLAELRKLRDAGTIRGVDGIWITHYHDDHTDYINDIVAEFGSRVYFTAPMAEVMGAPGSFRLPCLTTRPVSGKDAKRDGETLAWNEWKFTFWYFPGQTLYHGGLVAARESGETYLFAGDSFTPSGMDDYCMQNRVLLREGEGYDYCLRRIASLPKSAWVLNQHVAPMFRYTGEQVERMRAELRERSARLRELSPWPDINYMVDESWARVHPYGSEAAAGATVDLELRIFNHADARTRYKVRWNAPQGWKLLSGADSLTIPAGSEGKVRARFRAGAAGLHVVTADISFAGMDLREWTEALVRVK